MPDNLEFPLGVPTISGNKITMDEALDQPERITRDIAALTMQRFYMDQIFSAGGGVSGGALLFEQPNPLATDLYGEREPKEVAPGGEFPLQTFARGVPMIARPRKIGNKWFIVKEAVKRNDTSVLTRRMRQTANTIRRRIENMGIAELQAVITAQSRFVTTSTGTWATYAGLNPMTRAANAGPVSDIISTMVTVDLEERGHALNSMILHPTNAMQALQTFPGMTLQQIFAMGETTEFGSGITNIFVTPRYTVGRALLFESGQVGVWKNEFPLEEEAEWEGVASGGRQRWWYQWSISPMFAVVDPFAMMELRGI